MLVASRVFAPARRTVTVPFVTDIGDLLDEFTLRHRFEIVNESSVSGTARIFTSPAVFVPETTQLPVM